MVAKNNIYRSRSGKRHWAYGKHLPEKTREKISKAHLGKKCSKRTREKIRLALLGYKQTEEHRRRSALGHIGQKVSLEMRLKRSESFRGRKSHFWKGGITKKSAKIRNSLEYKLWRTAVFERDNYTCRFCGEVGGNLQADHIKPFSLFPELRFAIDNGRILCVKCHKTTDTYLNKICL